MDELRKALAGDIWRDEKVFAGWALVIGFFLKVSPGGMSVQTV